MNTTKDKTTIEALERQLERSGFFNHSSFSNQANRINEIEVFLYSLIDSLIDKDILDEQEFKETALRVKEEITARKEQFHSGIAVRVDQPQPENEHHVFMNCEERYPICKGVCCKLNYALSVEEIESGAIKWDLGQPYFIRQEKNGYCSHMDLDKKCCSVYDNRPKVCRKYTCINDKRIWKDFEKMELNQEWIDANLKERKLRLQEVYMIPEDNC